MSWMPDRLQYMRDYMRQLRARLSRRPPEPEDPQPPVAPAAGVSTSGISYYRNTSGIALPTVKGYTFGKNI